MPIVISKFLVSIVKNGNDIPLPNPTTYKATSSTLVDSSRNSKGYVIGSVIRTMICKIELSWNFLSAEEWAEILSYWVEDEEAGTSFFNDIKFLNQTTNKYETHTMYCGDATASIPVLDENGDPIGWKDCKINFIEV